MSEFGDYPCLFEALIRQIQPRVEFRTYRILHGDLPSRPDECVAWLITGSRHSVLERLSWMNRLTKLIREIVEQGIPVVGVCFGHQIMAEALGGVVGRAGRGWSIGRQVYDLVDNASGRTSIAINAFHEDQVLSIPSTAIVVGSSAACPLAILDYGTSGMSIQGHPEFSNDFVKALILLRLRGRVSDSFMSATLQQLTVEPDSKYAAQMIIEKLRLPS